MRDGPVFDDGVTRETFLARVTDALERSLIQAPESPQPEALEAIVRQIGANEDVVAKFQARAAELGLRVTMCVQSEVAGESARILRQTSAARVIIAPNVSDIAPTLNAGLRASGIEVLTVQPGDLSGIFEVDAGITVAVAGVADCGAIVCRTSGSESRLASLAPPVHIALLRASTIVPDLIDLFRRASGEAWPAESSAFTLIAGPSKTADIEGVLITGVHGPREVHVLLISDV